MFKCNLKEPWSYLDSSKPHNLWTHRHLDRTCTLVPEAELWWVTVDSHVFGFLNWIVDGEIHRISIKNVAELYIIRSSLLRKEFKISNTIEALFPSSWMIVVQDDILVLKHFIMGRNLDS